MNALFKIAVLIIFYAVGTLSHDLIYSWSLKTITFFTGNKVHFFGKLWNFLGRPAFGLLILAIPILNFLGIRILKITSRRKLFEYWISYLIFIPICYFATCYVYSLYLLKQIEAHKIGFENGSTHLHNVNIYLIGIITITLAAIFNFVYYRVVKPKSSQLKAQNTE
jgi:hypothetical protein